MRRALLFLICVLMLSCVREEKLEFGRCDEGLDRLAAWFEAPPMEYRPYVWWHWMGSNFSKEGIRADLEAMAEEGIAGATVFNLASAVQETHAPIGNNPWPEQTYRSEAYWEALAYAAEVAQELGLKIGLHNSPGYSTTGGPWITEEKGMQRVVSGETAVTGGQTLRLRLSRPELPGYSGWGGTGRKATFYRDIAVMAVPDKADVRPDEVLDLSDRMDAEGMLEWEAPAGKWRIVRLGHAPTLSNPHPLPDELIGQALEADKMSREVSAFHWDQVLEPLKEHLGPYIGKSFSHILIDSYEAGDQNWTPGFREAFSQMLGYDPMPYFALDAAGVDYESSFHGDLELAISRLYVDNGWKVAADKVHAAGLKLFWEPYWGPFGMEESVFLPDVPMGEFWSGGNGRISFRIVDAARLYGKKIVGAEAFTGRPENSHYTEDPQYLKHSADGAFLSGVNLLFLHHWVHQPFDDRYQPGMGMGWWGTHFGRNQTWFQPGKAFMAYLSRCQMMLLQGVLEDQGEGWIHRSAADAEIYFLANQNEVSPLILSFDSGGAVPEIWDPYTGTIFSAPELVEEGRISCRLMPGKSQFLVLPKGQTRYAKEQLLNVTGTEEKPVETTWKVDFAPKLDQPFTLKAFPLQDFSCSDDPRIKYFAGTATYSGHVGLSETDFSAGKHIFLNFGEMHDIAELSVNGKPVAVLWYPPFTADVTRFLKPGDNCIQLAVSVNWANRLIGDEHFEPDFEWGTDRGVAMGRAMKAFPDWFLKEERPSKGRKGFVLWSYFRPDSPLEPAGLIGPVKMCVDTTD